MSFAFNDRMETMAAGSTKADVLQTDCQPECWFWAGWEPVKHYQRRGGSRGTYYFGDGEWIDLWERRLFSNNGIEMSASMGATIVITQFYKGMGRDVESPLWDRLRRYVQRCNERGLKVWGYLQGSSIYREFIRSERPDTDDWIARGYDGSMQRWGSSYYRFAPCLTSPTYREYMGSIIREGVGKIGLDGIHMDNSYYRHCWCDRCQQKFRNYLVERGDLEERTGIPNVENIQAPPLTDRASYINDALQMLWMEFGVEVRLEFYRYLRTCLLEERPTARFSGNSAFPRTDLACKLRLALDPTREKEIFDFCCSESGNQTRFENGSFTGQTEAFLFAEAGRYQTWSTAWRESPTGNAPPPDAPSIWAVMAEEFTHGSAILGNNWAFRPSGEDDGFLMERLPVQTEAFIKARRFFATVAQTTSLSGRRSWTDVGILVDPHSFSISGPSDTPALRQLMQYFFHAKIPFQFVFPTEEIPASVNTLVVWSVSCLSRETLQQLTDFARKPGRTVVLSESSGIYNEWHIPYDIGFLRRWKSDGSFFIIPDRSELSKGSEAAPSGSHLADTTVVLKRNAQQLLDLFFKTGHFKCEMRFALPKPVLVHTERSASGELLIHLRDQAGSGNEVVGAEVWIADSRDFCRDGEIQFFAPGQSEVFLTSTFRDGGESVTIPPFRSYGLVVIPTTTATKAHTGP